MRGIFFVILTTFISFFCLMADPSTPSDGNLYVENMMLYRFTSLEIYSIDDLKKYHLVIDNNRIFQQVDKLESIVKYTKKTNKSDIVYKNNITVVLTGNSNIYNHGILGDNVESDGFEVYIDDLLYSEYRLGNKDVFETLRPTLVDYISEKAGLEIILTISNSLTGSRIGVFNQSGALLGESEPIGKGFRWLHILGVSTIKNGEKRVLAVETPHIGGILKSYKWVNNKLVISGYFKGVSTHKISSDNLNMALISNEYLLVPRQDFNSLLLLKIGERDVDLIREITLPSKLITNLFVDDKKNIWFKVQNDLIFKLSAK